MAGSRVPKLLVRYLSLPCALMLFIALVAVGSTTAGATAQEAGTGEQSRFQRTVLYMQSAPPELRAEFAGTALRHLSVAYTLEAELARDEAAAPGGDASLLGWSVAVEHYASALPLLLEDIELGYPVSLTNGGQESPGIAVAGRTVILSHPRPDQQSVFERSILADFCARHACDKYTPGGDAARQPIPVSAARVKPDWSFTQGGPVCSYRGIRVRFSSARGLSRFRPTCEQFLQEVMSLADEIAWQQRHAVTIDWERLTIAPTPRRPGHRVQLNRAGDSALLVVPVLYGSPGLLQDLTPWMRARLAGEPPLEVELEASRYGWESVAAEP